EPPPRRRRSLRAHAAAASQRPRAADRTMRKDSCPSVKAKDMPTPIQTWRGKTNTVEWQSSRGQKFHEGDCRMRLALWIAFFVISNLLGIEAFKAAVTLPSDERLVPSLLTFPLIGLTALSATRVLEAWRRRDE